MSTPERGPRLAILRGVGWLLVVSLAFPAQAVQARLAEAPVKSSAAVMSDAKALYVRRRYVEAARAFETLDTAGAVYNAAMARTAAGDDAHALLRWTRYLELAPDEERAEVQQRIDEIRQLTVEVRFVRSTDTDGARTLVLRADKHTPADDLRIPWSADQAEAAVFLDPGSWSATLEGAGGTERSLAMMVTRKAAGRRFDLAPAPDPSPVQLRIRPARALRRGVIVEWTGPRQSAQRRVITTETSQWKLVPGDWHLAAKAEGYTGVDRPVDVNEQPVQLALELKRPRDRARLGLGVGLGVAALGLAAGGGASLVLAGKTHSMLGGLDGHHPETVAQQAEKELQITQLWRRNAVGAALLTASGGTAVAALTAGLAKGRKALATETGVGAVIATVGLVLYGSGRDCIKRVPAKTTLDDPSPAEIDECTAKKRPAAMVAGFGAALLTTAVIALITRSVVRRKKSASRPHLDVSASGSGLAIQGEF